MHVCDIESQCFSLGILSCFSPFSSWICGIKYMLEGFGVYTVRTSNLCDITITMYDPRGLNPNGRSGRDGAE